MAHRSARPSSGDPPRLHWLLSVALHAALFAAMAAIWFTWNPWTWLRDLFAPTPTFVYAPF